MNAAWCNAPEFLGPLRHQMVNFAKPYSLVGQGIGVALAQLSACR
jgi:hypothetical protein